MMDAPRDEKRGLLETELDETDPSETDPPETELDPLGETKGDKDIQDILYCNEDPRSLDTGDLDAPNSPQDAPGTAIAEEDDDYCTCEERDPSERDDASSDGNCTCERCIDNALFDVMADYLLLRLVGNIQA